MSKESPLRKSSMLVEGQEGHPGRQRRLRSLITERIELMLGFRPPKIPKEIEMIVRGKLPITALMALWYSQNMFLWSDQEDDRSRGRSPFEMWKEPKYRADVEDFMRVMADNLSPEDAIE